MRPTVLLVAIVTLAQASPLLAQDRQELRSIPFSSVVQLPAASGHGSPRSDRIAARRAAQPGMVPHIHQNVSLRRVALGALIGGAAGAAIGYALGSRCGPTSSPEECAGYGRLSAVVAGGAGVFLGVHIAAGTP